MNNNYRCSTCKDANCFINISCTSKGKNEIDKQKNNISVKKDQMIFYENSPVLGIYFICHGKAKVFKTCLNNRCQTLRLVKQGDLLGIRGFNNKLFYPVGAKALENSHFSFISNEFFYKVMSTNAKFVINLLDFCAKELTNSEKRLKNFTEMSVKEKVIDALLMINRVYGEKSRAEKILLDIIFIKQNIAEIAGITYTQVKRSIAELKREHFIEICGKQIFITNYDGLKKSAYDFEL